MSYKVLTQYEVYLGPKLWIEALKVPKSWRIQVGKIPRRFNKLSLLGFYSLWPGTKVLKIFEHESLPRDKRQGREYITKTEVLSLENQNVGIVNRFFCWWTCALQLCACVLLFDLILLLFFCR